MIKLIEVKKPGTQNGTVLFEPPTCQNCQDHWNASLNVQLNKR